MLVVHYVENGIYKTKTGTMINGKFKEIKKNKQKINDTTKP